MVRATNRIHRNHNYASQAEQRSQAQPFFRPSVSLAIRRKPENAFFQPKLTIGQPDDKYEKEADAVASEVVNNRSAAPVVQQRKISSIQRMCPECEKEKIKGVQRMGMPKDERKEEEMIQIGDVSRVPPMACDVANTSSGGTQALSALFSTSNSTLTADQRNDIAIFVLSWQASGGTDTLRIDGYASTSGADEFNWKLSCDRAMALANELQLNGVPNNMIEIFAQGETNEFGAQANNQRAEITMISPPPPLEIASETKFSAPDGSPKTRKKVGVGEVVIFTANGVGDWAASDGTPDVLSGKDKFEWTAPKRAATVTIEVTNGSEKARKEMEVIEPSYYTAIKESEIAFPAGTQGAGMTLNFSFHPKTVSFGNVQSKEVSGPATNITGYYALHGTPHRHNSGDTFFDISQDNKWDGGARDTASQSGYPSPWSAGTFDWIIPNHFKLKSEAGDGKLYYNSTQSFRMIDATGKTIVSKGGEHVERTP